MAGTPALRPTAKRFSPILRRFSPVGRQPTKGPTPGPDYCYFPIAYHQLTSEQVRTRFVRGHPVRYWFKPSGKRTKPSTAASMPWPRCTRGLSLGKFFCARRLQNRRRGRH